MTGVPAPAGWTSRTPPSGLPHCVAEWVIEHGGHLRVRVFGPVTAGKGAKQVTYPARVEWRTGVSSFGPDLTDPAELKRFGWAVLQAAHAAADILDGAAPAEPAEEPYQHLTLDDFREDALNG